MAKPAHDPSALVTAALALDGQLVRFEAASALFLKAPLDTQKHLERAAHALNEIATLEEALNRHGQALVAALNAARDRQQAQAEAIRRRAEELKGRTEIYQSLLQQMGALGQDAAALNRLIQEQTSAAAAPPNGEGGPPFTPLLDRMDQVVASAESLATNAQEREFSDVARQADSLRQQLLHARNQLNLLQQRLRQ